MSRKKNILVFANHFTPHVGGLERYVEGLFSEVVKNRAFRIFIIAHGERMAVEKRGRLTILWLSPWLSLADAFCFPNLIHLLFFLRKIPRPDAISIHTRFFPLSLMGAAFGRLHGVPIIFTEHGSDHVRFPSSRVIEVGALLYDLTFGRFTIGLSTIRTGASLSACSFVRRLTGKRAILLENAVNLDFWTEVQTTNYQRFVFVGRIASGKGWDIAISAHRKLDPVTRSRFPLILAGSGSEVESLKRELRGDDNITYTGPLEQHGVRGLLKDSIMLNPTELAESLQTILIEAAACGAWILSSPTKEADSFLSLGFGQIVDQDWAAAMLDATTRLPKKPPEKILENYSWKLRASQFFGLLENLRKSTQSEK